MQSAADRAVLVLEDDASSQAILSGGAHNCSRGVCFRLPRHHDAGTGDAVLRFNAVLFARSSRPGLLQDHANGTRSFCAAVLRAWRFLLSRGTGSAASDWQISRPRFSRPCDCGTLPRATNPLLSSPTSHLASPPVGSQLEALVCFGMPVSTGGSICENKKSISHWAICECSSVVPPAALCFGSQSARPRPRDGSAPVPGWRTCLLQFDLHHTRPHTGHF